MTHDLPPPHPLAPTLQPSTGPQRRERDKTQDDDLPRDPFERIRFERNLELADQFRNDRLVERCYEVWKQGYEWIIVRSHSILRRYRAKIWDLDYRRADSRSKRFAHLAPHSSILAKTYSCPTGFVSAGLCFVESTMPQTHFPGLET